jgi:uncharacterized membrane protein
MYFQAHSWRWKNPGPFDYRTKAPFPHWLQMGTTELLISHHIFRPESNPDEENLTDIFCTLFLLATRGKSLFLKGLI